RFSLVPARATGAAALPSCQGKWPSGIQRSRPCDRPKLPELLRAIGDVPSSRDQVLPRAKARLTPPETAFPPAARGQLRRMRRRILDRAIPHYGIRKAPLRTFAVVREGSPWRRTSSHRPDLWTSQFQVLSRRPHFCQRWRERSPGKGGKPENLVQVRQVRGIRRWPLRGPCG